MALQKIIVETDSSVAVSIIQRGFYASPPLKFLLKEILSLARLNDWFVEFSHIGRTTNVCADILARGGHSGFFFFFSQMLVISILC